MLETESIVLFFFVIIIPVDEAFRSAAFETGVHLNELLSKYVTDVVLDKVRL